MFSFIKQTMRFIFIGLGDKKWAMFKKKMKKSQIKKMCLGEKNVYILEE